MRDRDSSLTLGMTRQWSGTRVVKAVRSANRLHYPILLKPLVIPNGSRKTGGMRNLTYNNRIKMNDDTLDSKDNRLIKSNLIAKLFSTGYHTWCSLQVHSSISDSLATIYSFIRKRPHFSFFHLIFLLRIFISQVGFLSGLESSFRRSTIILLQEL